MPRWIPRRLQLYLSLALATTQLVHTARAQEAASSEQEAASSEQEAATSEQLAATSEQEAATSEQRAHDLFQTARVLYDSGRVQEALDHLLQAKALLPEPLPRPVILFNIARCHETLGELRLARTAYRSYLDLEPDASDRGAIETRISVIDERLRAQSRLERELESRPTTPPETVNHMSTVVASTGVAMLAGAIGLRVAARQRRRDAVDDPVHDSAARQFEHAQDLARGANILFAVGGLTAAAGVTWLIVEIATADRGAVVVAVSASGGTLQVRF